MKKIFVSCLLACLWMPSMAQKLFFVYIQSDAGTPFYVKMNEKVLSSTASGYLIIPRLIDSSYSFQLGPSASEGELRFEIKMQQKDHGFLLKKFADGWGLFNLQTMAVIKPVNASTGFSPAQKLPDNPFTNLLSKAVGDTMLLYQPALATQTVSIKPEQPIVVQEVKDETSSNNEVVTTKDPQPGTTDSINAVASTNNQDSNTTASNTNAPPATVVANEDGDNKQEQTSQAAVSAPEEPSEPYKRSVVTRRAESSTVDGFGLVFWDDIDGVVDTVKIFIPNQRILFDAAATVETPQVINAPKAVAQTCNGNATEKDFFRVRKNMAAVDSETDMIAEAKSSFRKKCFSAEQIKNLSTLFLTQEGKWLFLEASYPFVADKASFSALQSELQDQAYITRFKALITQ